MSTKRSKTVEFPRFNLEKCEERLAKIPPAKPLTRDEILTIMGYTNPTSGPAGSAIGALVMFGLIQKLDGMYELTSLGKALRGPVSDSQKKLVRIIAWLLPQKFQEFYVKLKGKQVKSNTEIKSMMSQKHSVPDEAAKKFDRIFIDSGVHAGVITDLTGGNYKIRILDSIFTFLKEKPGKLNSPSDDVLDKTVDENVCKEVLDAVDKNRSKQTSKKEESITKEPTEYTPALTGDHEIVQFKLSDGIYIISKSDLEKIVRTKGKKVSEKIYSLDD